MEFLTALMLLLTPTVESDQYEYRIDDKSLDRVSKIFPYVRQAHYNTGVPPKILIGTIYTESNATPHVVGDGGRSFGLGQVRCAYDGFSWVSYLNDHFSAIQQCEDLKDPERNVVAMAEILRYSKEKSGKSWDMVPSVYNTGNFDVKPWQNQEYRRRVHHFGELFMPYYVASQKLARKVQELRTWRPL